MRFVEMPGGSVNGTGAPTAWSGDASLITPEPWAQSASCASADPEAFFPEKGGSTRLAKKVCASCDVIAECLDYALRNEQRFGIWGGKSERERRQMKREVAS